MPKNIRVSPLFNEEAAQAGANLVVEIPHEALTETGSGTAQTILLFKAKANVQSVELVRAELVVPFEDTATAGTDSTLVEIGDDGDTDRLLTSTQLNRNGTEVYQKAGTGTKHVFSADNTVDALFTPKTGTTLASLNKGLLRLYFKKYDSRD